MKNQLSALIDGEFDLEDAEHVVTALRTEGEVKEAWKYYHLIGDVIRGDLALDSHIAANIMQAIDKEPTVLAVNKKLQASQEATSIAKKRALKMPVFWSAAASVAAVMFVGLMVFKLQLDGGEEMVPVELVSNVPMEYLQAHQSVAPSGAAYYIQSANYMESAQ